jgi:hypothetical protein
VPTQQLDHTTMSKEVEESKADSKSEGKEDYEADSKDAKGGGGRPPPMVNVTSIDVQPNNCDLRDPLDISIDFSLDRELPNAYWQIKVRDARRDLVVSHHRRVERSHT